VRFFVRATALVRAAKLIDGGNRDHGYRAGYSSLAVGAQESATCCAVFPGRQVRSSLQHGRLLLASSALRA
jgi:hypothetical protein